jgi:hypothetical protein
VNKNKIDITILCSGMTLGVYTPAITVDRQLQAKGFKTSVEVFENLFSEEKRKGIKELKLACHRSFSIAKMAQKMAKDNNSRNFDATIVDELITNWSRESRSVFIVFSGYWMPILEKYRVLNLAKTEVYIFHMDATLSSSWKSYDTTGPKYKHIWLFEWLGSKIPCYLKIGNEMPVNFEDRKNRILIHGGGWGIGTYKSHINKLSTLGLKLDVIAYELADVNEDDENDYYMLDADWSPWEKNTDGKHIFPPLKKVKGSAISSTTDNKSEYSEVYNVLRNNKAIISKPGGGTLVDSFSSGTPLIMLEPYGEYEEKNASLWFDLGMGIYYQDWVNSNYSFALLEQMHVRIVALRNQKESVLDVYFNDLEYPVTLQQSAI